MFNNCFQQELTFKERAEVSNNKIAQQLFTVMEEKRSNLAVSVDLTLSQDILQVTESGYFTGNWMTYG